MSDDINNPEDVFNANSRTLTPAAVGSQLALMSIISAVTIIAFNVLRPKNKIIYEPKIKYHVGNKPPPRISDSIFGWVPPLIYTKEPELVDKIGLDAVTFLRFLRMLRWLFTGVALLTCGILIPVNISFNLKNVQSQDRDGLSMLTIRDVSGNWLFVHVAVSYLITILICGCIHYHWRQIVRLRHDWFRSPEYIQSFYARTLQVLHVPKRYQSDAGIQEIFQSLQVPYPTTSVHIGRKVGKLPELIEYHNDTVRQLEQCLVKYLRNGRIGKKRPTMTIGGTCGIGGQKKDAIDFYTAKLKRTEAAIEEYRAQIDNRKAENYGFASMAAVPYAHIVAKMLEGKRPKGTNISLAPNPKDIIWSNMSKSDAELTTKRIHGFFWLAFVCFLNTIPLLIISALANLEAIAHYVPFLQHWAKASPTSFSIISGVLPPAVSGIFGFFLPVIMRWLTRYMGALTHSRLDRAVIARYFSFLVISQLVVFTLIGVIFNSVEQIVRQIGRKSFQEIIDNLHTLPDRINRTYIDQASYWLTFFPLRGFLVLFDLAQILNLVWLSIKTHLFGRTPRDIREWTQPPDFQYAIYYSNMLFMSAVGLVFAPLAPLVAVAAGIVFWISSFVYKYQLMFVFVSKVESGGRLWNVVINRLLFSVMLMQVLLLLTIGLQYGFKSLQWLSTIPPIFIMIGYKIYSRRVFLPSFRYYNPTEEELRMAQVHSERADHKGNRLEKRFGHPALHTELFTPMLHAKMIPLLSQVYSGKISTDKARLDEYGGQKMDAQVVEGGIKIAAIHQNDLEYDLALYRRDRGELDWDARSIASTTYLNDGPTNLQASSTSLPGYDRYLANGPAVSWTDNIELAPLDSPSEPLLSPQSQYFQQNYSQQSLGNMPPTYRDPNHGGMNNEAPLHRPRESYAAYGGGVPRQPTMERSASPFIGHSPSASPLIERGSPSMERSGSPFVQRSQTPQAPYPPQPQRPYSPHTQQPSQSQYSYHSQQGGSGNMAGRGAHKAW